ncbi:MAG TPA: hypothetical protein VFE05_04265 [Longimicrobiaceae bacterium]|jgi:hypothetical protein|nr:hypothetical protein [Longimicrobiaceae bacterium]
MNRIDPDELQALLETAHAGLHAAGQAQDVWQRLRCTCGRPDCEIHDPARHTVTLQLDALAAYWRPELADAPARGRLAAALAPLARLVDADTDPEDDADALLHRVRDAWLAGMGTPLGGPPGEVWLEDLARVEARNGLLLEKLLERFAGAGFALLAHAGAAHARQRRDRAAAEGLAACGRTVRAWIDDHDSLPQRTLLREHLLALLREAPWTAGEAQDVFRMAEDAATAVLAYGIADDLWVAAAYGAAERVAPFSALRIAVVLEDDPAAAALAS